MKATEVRFAGYWFDSHKATITCIHVLGGEQICAVAHHSDGSIQILCDKMDHSESSMGVVGLGHVFDVNDQAAQVPQIDPGCCATRTILEDGGVDRWEIHELEHDD